MPIIKYNLDKEKAISIPHLSELLESISKENGMKLELIKPGNFKLGKEFTVTLDESEVAVFFNFQLDVKVFADTISVLNAFVTKNMALKSIGAQLVLTPKVDEIDRIANRLGVNLSILDNENESVTLKENEDNATIAKMIKFEEGNYRIYLAVEDGERDKDPLAVYNKLLDIAIDVMRGKND